MTNKEALKNSIKEFEALHDFKLPNDFKEHLYNFEDFKLTHRFSKYTHNGKEVYQIINSFFPFNSETHKIFTVAHRYNDLVEEFKGYIPFANDPGGAFFLISTKDHNYGHVLFYTMEDDIEVAQIVLANSFTEFINKLSIQ